MKKEARSGEKKSGSQPVNNSLASFRHQRGRNSTDTRPANACTNSCGKIIVVKYTFQNDNFCRCLRNIFILSCYLILFDVFEGQLSLSNINRTRTVTFPAEN